MALPDHLLREILVRLPIKSLVRFQCVEKAWKTIILDQVFVKNHQTRLAAQNPSECDCIIFHKEQLSILYHDKETIVCPSSSSRYGLQLVGCVAGMVCLRQGHKYSLWNPAVHQSVQFSLPPYFVDILDGVNHGWSDVKIAGLGYDFQTDSYKVAVCYKVPGSTDLGIVYSSDSADWKTINDLDSLFTPDYFDGYNLSDSTSPCVTTGCCPYWANRRGLPGDDYKQFKYLHGVKFDVENDKFVSLPPFRTDRKSHYSHYQFTSIRDSLTVLGYKIEEVTRPELSVYCLEKEKVWTFMYKIGPVVLDETRGLWRLAHGFRFNDEILFHKLGRYFLYDKESGKGKLLQSTTTGEVRSCYSYTPTLALVPGMRCVYNDSVLIDNYTHKHDSATIDSCPRFPWRLIHSLDFLSDDEERDY